MMKVGLIEPRAAPATSVTIVRGVSCLHCVATHSISIQCFGQVDSQNQRILQVVN